MQDRVRGEECCRIFSPTIQLPLPCICLHVSIYPVKKTSRKACDTAAGRLVCAVLCQGLSGTRAVATVSSP